MCLIAEVNDGRITKIYEDHVQVVRLGQEVSKNRRFHPQALERARACLVEFADIISRQRPERVLAMATSAARDVTNAEDLFKIGKDLCIPIEVIPGGREAEITFQGATSHYDQDNKCRLVVDVGGGSTEFVAGKNHRVLFGQSLDIGCVRLTEKWIYEQPSPKEQVAAAALDISQQILRVRPEIEKIGIEEIIAVAGTPSALAAIELGGFDVAKVDGYCLTRQRLQEWVDVFSQITVEEKMRRFNLERGRADVILVGSLILLETLKQFNRNELTVSVKGVRYGIALEIASRTLV